MIIIRINNTITSPHRHPPARTRSDLQQKSRSRGLLRYALAQVALTPETLSAANRSTSVADSAMRTNPQDNKSP